MSAILDYMISSSVSLTVAGTTGISPFLTLFLLGIIEKSDPTVLNMSGVMNGTIETVLASWISIFVLGLLTIGDFVGKCVPFIDEAIDSIEVFVVPVLSVLGSLGTLGLLDLVAKGGDGDVDVVAIATGIVSAAVNSTDGDNNSIEDTVFDVEGDSSTSSEPDFLMVLKGVVILLGIFLSLSIHIFKMIMRIIGLACSGGCCSPCFTIIEVTITTLGVMLAVFIQPIAIVMVILLLFAAGFAINRKCKRKKDENGDCNNGDCQKRENSQNRHREEKIETERGIEIGGHHQSQSLNENDVEKKKTNSTNPPLAVAVPF